jgi:hypothetical protein
VCGVDPLNLTGTLLPGVKVPALVSNRLVYRDGLPAAAEIAGKQQYWVELDQIGMAASAQQIDPALMVTVLASSLSKLSSHRVLGDAGIRRHTTNHCGS